MQRPEDGLAGAVGIVTGATSAIGAAATRALLEQDARVLLVARDAGRLEAAASSHGDRARVLAMDVADETAWDSAVGEARAWGPVGALIAVAGVARRGPFVQGRVADWEEMWRTNVLGTMLAARACVPDMLARRFGRIIVVSSVGAVIGLRDRVAYTATKGALESLTRSLAVELGGTGVTVNAIAPGALPTAQSRRWLEDEPALAHETLGAIPEARFGTADDLLPAFRHLLAAAYAQGSTVTVDGGWSIG